MKKVMAIILASVLAFSLCACGNSGGSKVKTEEDVIKNAVTHRANAAATVRLDNEYSGIPTTTISYSRETSNNSWEVSGKVSIKDKYGNPLTYLFDATVLFLPETNDAQIIKFELK